MRCKRFLPVKIPNNLLTILKSNFLTFMFFCVPFNTQLFPHCFHRATACNATHGIAVAILAVRPSVCLSVRRVYCDTTKWTADILKTHETAITLVFWHQRWLVGDPPSLWNLRSNFSHPFEKRRLRQISAHNVSTVGNSEKKFNYDEYKVDHGLSNKL